MYDDFFYQKRDMTELTAPVRNLPLRNSGTNRNAKRMSMDSEGPRRFATTRWSQVIRAKSGEGAEQMEAMTSLCEAYWHPLYFFVRRKVGDSEKAKDLIQGFFCKLLEKDYLKSVDPEKGLFRAFLITAVKRYMWNEKAKQDALIRGGGIPDVSLDFEAADVLYAQQENLQIDPESLYDRAWAFALLHRVFNEMEKDHEAKGEGELFRALKASFLKEPGAMKYEEMAEKFDMPVNTIKSRALRLKGSYGDYLRDAVHDTVGSEEEIDDELLYLISLLSK